MFIKAVNTANIKMFVAVYHFDNSLILTCEVISVEAQTHHRLYLFATVSVSSQVNFQYQLVSENLVFHGPSLAELSVSHSLFNYHFKLFYSDFEIFIITRFINWFVD